MRDSPELSGELVLAGFFVAGNIQESRDMEGLHSCSWPFQFRREPSFAGIISRGQGAAATAE
jgi:hypothetical protein